MANNQKRQLKGEVISNKMNKTVLVQVEKIKTHPKYHKRYSQNKKFTAHDEKNQYQVGDKVIIQEHRPISKNKSWQVIKKIKP